MRQNSLAFPDTLRTSRVRWRTISKGIHADGGLTSPAAALAAEPAFAGKDASMSQPQGSEYYHRRADEMRLAAIEARSSDNRDTLRSFAVYFDRLADEAERAEQARPEKVAAC